ncbi:hypothetical protein GMORB2_5146, partial [Geosmithia morbida]
MDFAELDGREKELRQIAKSWSIAMKASRDRLQKVYKLRMDELDAAIHEGRLVLETVCLFVHASLRCQQFSLPPEFWRILQTEFGIIVYPSALTEPIDTHGVGSDITFTDAYSSHIGAFRSPCRGSRDNATCDTDVDGIVMLGRCCPDHPPPCPFEYLREPPPPYQRQE